MRVEGMGRIEGCKLVRVSADIEDGIIRFISIRGDFFASPEEGFERAEEKLAGVRTDKAGMFFDAFLEEEGVKASGINGAALDYALADALRSLK